jgi:hypothetical protein
VTRRWIIEKGHRLCRDYGCPGHFSNDDGKLTRSSVNAESGKITTVCIECEKLAEYQARSFKDRRPCKSCGHVRDITVRFFYGDDVTEHFHETCDACDLESSAASHYYQAQRFAERARKIRAARKKGKQEKTEDGDEA